MRRLFGGFLQRATSMGTSGARGGGDGAASGATAAAAEPDELWFTGLDDFKPICHMLHRGRTMTAYFACAHATGQHFLLKKYDKRAWRERSAGGLGWGRFSSQGEL